MGNFHPLELQVGENLNKIPTREYYFKFVCQNFNEPNCVVWLGAGCYRVIWLYWMTRLFGGAESHIRNHTGIDEAVFICLWICFFFCAGHNAKWYCTSKRPNPEIQALLENAPIQANWTVGKCDVIRLLCDKNGVFVKRMMFNETLPWFCYFIFCVFISWQSYAHSPWVTLKIQSRIRLRKTLERVFAKD